MYRRISKAWFQIPIIGMPIQFLTLILTSVAATIAPLLKIPGTAGNMAFSLKRSAPGMLLMLVYDRTLANYTSSRGLGMVGMILLVMSFTALHQIVTGIRGCLKTAIKPTYIGKSIACIFPIRRKPQTETICEVMLCLISGICLCSASFPSVGSWTVVAGICYGMASILIEPLDWSPIELLQEKWEKMPSKRPWTKRVACRVTNKV